MIQNIMIQQNNRKIRQEEENAQAATLAAVQAILNQSKSNLIDFEICSIDHSLSDEVMKKIPVGKTWTSELKSENVLINSIFIKNIQVETQNIYQRTVTEFKDGSRTYKSFNAKTDVLLKKFDLVRIYFIDGTSMLGNFKKIKKTSKVLE